MDMMMRWRRDPEALKGKKFERALVRRVVALARPYRWKIAGFLVAVIATAGTAVLQPLLLRSLINTAFPQRDRGLVTFLALAAVFLAAANAALSMVQRWLQAVVKAPQVPMMSSHRLCRFPTEVRLLMFWDSSVLLQVYQSYLRRT